MTRFPWETSFTGLIRKLERDSERESDVGEKYLNMKGGGEGEIAHSK